MRSEKISILNEVIERVKGSDYCFIINYGAVKVAKLTGLRSELAKLATKLMIVKNTHLAKAAKEAGWEDISALLSGPTAMVTGKGDVAEVAKAIVAFAKDNDTSKVKGASVEKKILGAADVEALSKLPGKDTMRAMLLSTLVQPATSFVRVLNAPLLDVLYALKAKVEKDGGAKPAA
jgi:large subunit ribosomal protein L10